MAPSCTETQFLRDDRAAVAMIAQGLLPGQAPGWPRA